MQCRFCNNSRCSLKKKVQSSYNQQFYELYSCHDCGSYFFNNQQYSASLKELYNKISVLNENDAMNFLPSGKWLKQVAVIKKLLHRNPASILDVGCRTGDFLMHFNRDTRREGVELSEHSARIGIHRGLTIYNDFLENIDFKKKYDVVSAYAIMEHLMDPLKFINKLNEIINPAGLLIILIPTHQCLKRKFLDFFGTLWHMYSPPEHLNFYSRKFLDKYLQDKGFRMVKRFYTSGGMINLFPDFHLLKKMTSKLMDIIDNSPLNRLPIFDHMYSYYILKI